MFSEHRLQLLDSFNPSNVNGEDLASQGIHFQSARHGCKWMHSKKIPSLDVLSTWARFANGWGKGEISKGRNMSLSALQKDLRKFRKKMSYPIERRVILVLGTVVVYIICVYISHQNLAWEWRFHNRWSRLRWKILSEFHPKEAPTPFRKKIPALETQTGWWFQPIWKILVKLELFLKYGRK